MVWNYAGCPMLRPYGGGGVCIALHVLIFHKLMHDKPVMY